MRTHLLLVALFLAATTVRAETDDAKVVYNIPLRDAAVKGPATAKITIVEFSDFQCPFCSRAEKTLQALEAAHQGELRIAFKHNPLAFHAHALIAAEAALAAGEQGHFWEMHDKLFANQAALDRASLESYAEQLGLDMEQFRAALDSHKFKEQIERDQNEASTFQANGTPQFFINGRRLKGAQPLEVFESLISEELVRANQLLAAGTPRLRLYEALVRDGKTRAVAPSLQPAPSAERRAVSVTELGDSPSRGPALAKVTIVEFSDFQCPFCGRAEATLQRLLKEYPHDVRLIYKHQPLPFHPNALPAAIAAEAAHRQGAFWKFHDLAFENQRELASEKYVAWAQQLGLDAARFEADLKDPSIKERIDRDGAYGQKVGANGTPTFFVNGREVVGAQPYETFKAVVDEELKKADALLAKGVPLNKLYDRIVADNVAAAPKAPNPPTPALPAPEFARVPLRDAPIKGQPTAKVTVVEFTDFQCPFCGRAELTLQQLQQKYGRDLRIVFKNQPLPFHPNALPAAEAALAAGEQGHFWQMQEKLFANQQDLSPEKYEAWAEELGLNMEQFREALSSHKFRPHIDRDSKEGTSVGANGTPTFFVNGRKVVGAQPLEVFQQIIDLELKKADKLLAQGTDPSDLYEALLQQNTNPK